MNSHVTARFRKAYRELPVAVRKQADAAFMLFTRDPLHKSLRFKRVHATEEIYSARVGLHYRAIAVKNGDDVIWFWIGSHADYDQLLTQF